MFDTIAALIRSLFHKQAASTVHNVALEFDRMVDKLQVGIDKVQAEVAKNLARKEAELRAHELRTAQLNNETVSLKATADRAARMQTRIAAITE